MSHEERSPLHYKRGLMRLAVVTVNYCCAEEIVHRLKATALQIAACDGEWWIVENKSPDDSAEVIRAAIADLAGVHLIVAETNGGFAYGHSQVINRVRSAEITTDYIQLLHPDP